MSANYRKYLLISIVIIITCFVVREFLYKKEEKISTPDNEEIIINTKKPVDTSSWTSYTNSQLGFSVKIPLEVDSIYRCPDSRQAGNTPLVVFEDNENGSVYISQEYYYDANWSQSKQDFTGECNKISYSLEILKQEEKRQDLLGLSSHPFLGWKIIINNPKDDSDIADFIKQNFGSTCVISSKTLAGDGIYNIKMKGEDWNTVNGFGNCPINFSYRVIYSPEKHKLMSVILGQECTFGTDPLILSSYQCYDEEMIKSFKFE